MDWAYAAGRLAPLGFSPIGNRGVLVLNVNEYFDGNVKSISFGGQPLASTVGVMAPGEYEFSTSKKEVVTVVSGELSVKLPDAVDFSSFPVGASFTVAANQTFCLQVEVDTAYLCTYE